tara:strand:+ start:5213 stop:5407 length:195 start_codon:yes stop_codon:yes gene_type:complete
MGEENVAPITGAWIETCIEINVSAKIYVAPITGAWIETELEKLRQKKRQGRVHHGRGSKHSRGF